MNAYIPTFIFFGCVIFITGISLALSFLFSSKETSQKKYEPYESGILTETHLLQERFSLHHYLVALMFLIFDVGVVFFYPWAVVAKKIGLFALFEMGFFLVVLSIGFIYVWRKGGLRWE